MNKAPDISSFHYDISTNGEIESSINMYRGAVCFDYTILELAKHANVGISLIASYNSDIDKNINLPNYSSPTGIIGAGWSLTYNKIECNKSDIVKAPQDRNYRLTTGDCSGGGTPLHIIGHDGDSLIFENEAYDHSLIVFEPQKEVWTITDADGIKYIYGGKESENNYLEYAVLSDGVFTSFPCNNVSMLSRGIKSWVLKEIVSPFGNSVIYEYDYDEKQVCENSPNYTKAVYIRRITDSFGNRAELIYEDKEWSASPDESSEYVDPYNEASDSPFNFHQSEYETKYLSTIEVSNESGLLYKIMLGYSIENFSGYTFNYGKFAKRMLRSIQMVHPNRSLPAMKFDYCSSTETNCGALKAIEYPEGGIVRYGYSQALNSQISDLTETISCDSKKIKSFFGNDYTVFIDIQNNKASSFIYRWIGRWQKYTPEFNLTNIDPDTINVYSQNNYAIISGKSSDGQRCSYSVMTKYRKIKGGWFSSEFTQIESSDINIVTGSNWFIIHSTDTDDVDFFYYDELEENWIKSEFPDDFKMDDTFSIFTAYDNRLVCFTYDDNGIGKKNKIRVYEINCDKHWNTIISKDADDLLVKGGRDGNIYITTNGHFIAGVFVSDKTPHSVNYTCVIWRIDANNTLTEEVRDYYSLQTEKVEFTIPNIAGNTVISAGYLYRFSGTEWIKCTSIGMNRPGEYQFAVSEDIAAVSYISKEGMLKIDAAVFNREDNVWDITAITKKELKDSMLAGVSISGSLAVLGDKVYDISDMTFNNVIDTLSPNFGTLNIYNNNNFIASSTYTHREEDDKLIADGSYIRTYSNGHLVSKYTYKKIFSTNCSGSYCCFTLENSNMNIDLIYAGNGEFKEDVPFYQAVSAEIYDGIDTVKKSYLYDNSKASSDDSSQYAHYSEVAVIKNDGSKNVYKYHDSVSNSFKEDNLTNLSVNDGTLESVLTYLNGKLKNTFSSQYVLTNTVNGKKIYGNTLSEGKLVEISNIDDNNNGVEKISEFKVDTLSGRRIEAITYNYDADGKMEKSIIRSVPAYMDSRYSDKMKAQHRLTDICEERSFTDEALISLKEVSYASFDDLFAEDNVVKNSHTSQQKDNLYTIKKREKYGNVSSKCGTFNEYFIFDKNGLNRIAAFTNSDYGECFAYTFEDYEEFNNNYFNNASVTTEVCYAGTKCVKINAGGSYQIKHTFTAGRTEYGLSFYAECAAEGNVTVKYGSNNIKTAIEKGKFRYEIIDLSKLNIRKGEQAVIEITFSSNNDLYIDAVSFFPLYNPPQISVYYNSGALLAASLSGYGDISEPVYDELSRSICVVKNKKVINCSIPSFSSESKLPLNSNLSVQNAEDGVYYKIVNANDGFDVDLDIKKNLFVNFRTDCNFEISSGGSIIVQYKTGELSLSDGIKKYSDKINENSVFNKFITLILSDTIILAVDGVIIFSVPKNGEFTAPLKVRSSGTVRDLAAGLSPVVKMTYTDKCGKIRQEHKLCGKRAVVTASGYDSFGRKCIDTIPTYISDNILKYIDGYIKNINNETGAIDGIVNDLNPQCEGYPFTSATYEERYNGRVLEMGMPCKDFAIVNNTPSDKRHTTRYSYSCAIPDSKLLEQLRLSQADKNVKHYTAVRILDPDNNEVTSIYDLRKQKIADIIKFNNKEICTTYVTKAVGNFIEKKIIMPEGNNKYTRYDLRGNLIYISDVNAGEKKYFYDINNNLRFEKNSSLETQGLCKYRMFDNVFRLIEEGIFKTALSDEELQEKTSDALFPQSDRIISRKYYYDGDHSKKDMGMLTRIEAYSETPDNSIINTVLIKTDKDNNTISKTFIIGENTITNVNKYDNFGNVICKIGSDGKSLDYEYDQIMRNISVSSNNLKITETDYTANGLPEKVTTCGNTINYTYNGRNKVTNIDSPFYSEKITYLDGDKYYNGKIRKLISEIKASSENDVPNKISYDLEYDECGQLVSAVCSESEELSMNNICYDKNGNLKSYNNTEFETEAGTDKIVKTDKSTYEYNADGAVSKISGSINISIDYYQYSGLPKKISTDDSITDLIYDEHGKRLKKTVRQIDGSEKSRIYLYDGDRLSEEISNGKNKKYIHGISGINAVLEDDRLISVITDRLGYTRVVAESQEIIQAYHYKPFGEVLEVIKKSELVKTLFGNYELDDETGLYYAKARLYDPKLFRFLSPDPKGEFTSPYTFCGNDPFTAIDENGEASWIGALIGAVVGIVITITLTVATLGAGTAAATALGLTVGTAAYTATEFLVGIGVTTAIALVSGFASEGVKDLINGESFAASAAYEILISSVLTGLIFGGVGSALEGIRNAKILSVASMREALGTHIGEGACLALCNAAARAAISPVNDVLNGESVSGINAAISAAFGALSGALTVFAGRVTNQNLIKDVSYGQKAAETCIWSIFDPSTYYYALTSCDSSNAADIYDSYSVGSKQYVCSEKQKSSIDVNNQNIMLAYSCFNDKACNNINSPRFFSSRGFGQKMI